MPVAYAQQAPPNKLFECENGGTKICGTWTLIDSKHYYATWDNGATATITINYWGPQYVSLYRVDTGGGFTGSYWGYLNNPNHSIDSGSVTWTTNGRSWSGTWDADFSA